MYENVAVNHASCIDSLTRSFDRADSQISNFTKSFIIELIRRILDNDPSITADRKDQAIRRVMGWVGCKNEIESEWVKSIDESC